MESELMFIQVLLALLGLIGALAVVELRKLNGEKAPSVGDHLRGLRSHFDRRHEANGLLDETRHPAQD